MKKRNISDATQMGFSKELLDKIEKEYEGDFDNCIKDMDTIGINHNMLSVMSELFFN